ncbi:phosphatase PAP2 family protein [Vreelandella andesensis]|uniref:Phosphatase PAP2 family protein n=1 Tax=Vreelandella andesensis TaxID=447567 RepID=A0A433KTC0_9GAMM|nr:bifunctional DedA family/phosphatase PAP2 family protein [Halomonas andesensis]RUR32895.1 phosphatase PAP2 family protein [Halomonas andesensis]
MADMLFSLSLSPAMLLLMVALISLLESLALIGLLVPGVVLITAAASLAGHQAIALPWLISAALLGAILGDGISYQLGYHHREQVTNRWPLSMHPEWLERGVRFFERYGVHSVFIGRFVGPVRPIIPLIAGMMRMPPRTFLWANVTSAALWAPAYVLPGYLLGRTWQQHLNLPANIETAVITLGVCVVIVAVIFSWGRAQTSRHGFVYFTIARLIRRVPFIRRSWLSMSLNDEVPLASLLLFVITLASVSAWTLLVMNHQGPLSIDLQAQRLFYWLSNEPLQLISVGLAKIGDSAGITALLLPLAVWLIRHKRMDALFHLAVAIGGIALLNTIGKMVFGRIRPETPDYLTGSFSYPSAHTSTIVVVVGLAAAFIAAEVHRKQRIWVYWLAIILVTPMALSRLILGVHWLSDLIGGILLGLLVCALIRLNWQRRSRAPLPHCPWGKLLTATLVLVSLRVFLLPPV